MHLTVWEIHKGPQEKSFPERERQNRLAGVIGDFGTEMLGSSNEWVEGLRTELEGFASVKLPSRCCGLQEAR